MDIVNTTVDGDQLKLWIEDYKIVGAQTKSTLFLDAYADMEDLIGFDSSEDVLVVTHVKGLANTTIVDCQKVFKRTTNGEIYTAVEQAFEFYMHEGDEVVFKDDEFVGMVFKENGLSTCLLKHEEFVGLITDLTNHDVQTVYINPDIFLNRDVDLDVSIKRLKRELMESLKSTIAQAFTGEKLNELVMEYGGHSKFQRKKRIKITKERLESVLGALRMGKGLSQGIYLSSDTQISSSAIFRTINKFLPEDAAINAFTNREEIKSIITEILANIDVIKNHRLGDVKFTPKSEPEVDVAMAEETIEKFAEPA